MGVKGLELLFLEVESLEESLAFYAEGLGFEVLAHTPEAEPPMATLRGGRLRLTLAQVPLAMARRGRGVHFFLTVEDVDDYYAFLRTGGLDVAPPADEGWGGRFVTLEDPNHYRLFFVAWDG
ncbi:MAG TPA: VOC family protein [Pyrinomonadaceae bacterium]|jgi:catechol 2,3-dioxygenase-like lactoylglutathione lyase family enzyme|nr:VOC family protein [Pyrinomonadaceae bacterium]